MRIIILNWKDLAHPEAGGAERYVHAVASIWNAAGHHVTVFTPRLPGRPSREMSGGIEYLREGTRLTTFARARRHLREFGHQYDQVIESVSTRPYVAHAIVGAKATALYHQIADDVWSREFALPLALLGRHVLEPFWLRRMRGARIVAISPSTAADLARFGIDIIGIVPPGCDVPPSCVPVRQLSVPPRLVFIGRLVRAKRPDHAVAAFRRIAEVYPEARLDVIGEGYLADALARDAGPGVVFHGHLSEGQKAELLSAADAVLFPGTREGWGIVTIEAAVHGVPVVAYDVPGLRDAVVDNVTGVLTADNPQSLAEATISLLQSPARWQSLSTAARNRALKFTWEVVAAEVLQLLVGRPHDQAIAGYIAPRYSTSTSPSATVQ